MSQNHDVRVEHCDACGIERFHIDGECSKCNSHVDERDDGTYFVDEITETEYRMDAPEDAEILTDGGPRSDPSTSGSEQLDRLPDGKIPAPARYVEYDGQVIVRERYSTHQRWKNAGSHDGKRGDPPTILGSQYCRDEDEVLKPKNDHLNVNEIEVYYVDDSESVVYEVADDEPEIRADGSGEPGKERCWDHEDCPRDDCDGELQQQDQINVECTECERVWAHYRHDGEHQLHTVDGRIDARKPVVRADGGEQVGLTEWALRQKEQARDDYHCEESGSFEQGIKIGRFNAMGDLLDLLADRDEDLALVTTADGSGGESDVE